MSLTLAEARERTHLLSGVSYDVHLDLRQGAETFTSVSEVRFSFSTPGASVFLELAAGLDVRVRLNDVDLPSQAYDGRRIELTGLSATNRVQVAARLVYASTGDGMHRFVDPVDGEAYVSAYCGMDNVQRVFACFDQPDLRAPLTLTVEAPQDWTVLASGAGAGPVSPGRWEFDATPPIPTYLFVVCAGPWHSTLFEHDGRTFGWHARRSLAAALDRDADELRELTVGCWDHYSSIFEEPYPFADYHSVLVPELNWGAQENPGCVTFRDEFLPAGPVSAQLAARRAMVVAHEMAHMWFGNLVTMEWFDDAWLSESFADYLGFTVAELVTGHETGVDFVVDVLPAAYAADARRSTHPVAPAPEEVVDVDTAFGNFDAISYAKGNAAVRQLVAWLGEEDFLRGVNIYLTRHRLGAARLADFVAALAEGSGRDVAGWAQDWLRTTGFDTVEVTRTPDGAVLRRVGSRPHRLRVTCYDADGHPPTTTWVELGEQPVVLAAVGAVLPNSHGDTFARLRLDEASLGTLTADLSGVPDAVARAVLWTTVHDLVRSAELDPQHYLALLRSQLPAERRHGILDGVLAQAQRVVLPRYVAAHAVPAAREAVALTGQAVLAASPDGPVALSAMRAVGATSHDRELLRTWLADGVGSTGVALDPALRWDVVRRLAELGDPEAADLIGHEQQRDPSSTGMLGAATAQAAIPAPAAKAEAWAVMTDPATSNRLYTATARGMWSAEQPALLQPYVERYLTETPALAREQGQGFSLLIAQAFPAVSLGLLGLQRLDQALSGDLPTVLRRGWQDSRDDLALAVASLERFG